MGFLRASVRLEARPAGAVEALRLAVRQPKLASDTPLKFNIFAGACRVCAAVVSAVAVSTRNA